VKTVGEIDRTGKVVRIFHRTATAAWTHAPGERYRYRTQDGGWVEMRCDCPVSGSTAAVVEVGVTGDYADAVAEAQRLGLTTGSHATDRCQCPECGEVFSAASNFDRHLQRAAVRFADDYDGPWCCPPREVGLVQSQGGWWHLPGPEVPGFRVTPERGLQ
jgi:hypothetical protein